MPLAGRAEVEIRCCGLRGRCFEISQSFLGQGFSQLSLQSIQRVDILLWIRVRRDTGPRLFRVVSFEQASYPGRIEYTSHDRRSRSLKPEDSLLKLRQKKAVRTTLSSESPCALIGRF